MFDYQSIKYFYFKKIKNNTSAKVAVWIACGLIVIAIFKNIIINEKGFAIIPYSAINIDGRNANYSSPLSSQDISDLYHRHWFGTDQIGRDVAAGLIEGTRTALIVGIGGISISVTLGIFLGILSGYYSDNTLKINFLKIKIPVPIDFIVMRVVAIVQSVPSVLWLLSLAAVMQRFTLTQLILFIGLLFFPAFTQMVRGEMLRIRNEDYILAAKALGLSDFRIFIKHALPNILAPILVSAVFGIAQCILLETAISFIGLGLPAEQVTWGTMLNQARLNFSAWWLAVFPGFMIFLTVISLNKISEMLKKT